MSITRSSLTVGLLQNYYSNVMDLRLYLVRIVECNGDGGSFLFGDGDPGGYNELVNGTYVASKESLPSLRFKFSPPMMYMRDVIDRAQEQLFVQAKGKPHNVITSGYRQARQEDLGRRTVGRLGIVNTFVNTVVTALNAPHWETLLQRVGVDAIFHLLTETSMFVSLPNNCLCQITGDPIIFQPVPPVLMPYHPSRKRKLSEPQLVGGNRPIKRSRTNHSFESISSVTKRLGPKKEVVDYSPIEISLVRARLFYARPSLVPRSNHYAVGLPPKHVLHRLKPSFRRVKHDPATYVDPDPRKQAADMRHLAKYVFPRQFGLNNPFSLVVEVWRKGPHRFPDFGDREEEIKNKGKCKTPKRVKSCLALLNKLIWRHGKCGYKPLRDMACPSKIKQEGANKLDSSIILELMAEKSSFELYSQAPDADTSANTSILPLGLTQAAKHKKYKPRFVEFSCSHAEVFQYVLSVTKSVIPPHFWGSKKNFALILRHVKKFISCRRYETLSLHQILEGFVVSDCEWLMPDSEQSRVPVTDSLKRREMLEEFLFWYFDSFVLPLLKTVFYVTECSSFRYQVLYFRHDDWATLCAPLIEKLTTDMFVEIPQREAEEILRQRKLGFSFVRLLPKETGVRPIVNLRRRPTARRGLPEQSINQILQATFQILAYEKQARPERLGTSVFGANEVYSKLKSFKARLPRTPSGDLPRLYFVKVDVQACFDTIEQGKLLDILSQLISENHYMLHRHGQVTQWMGKVRRKHIKQAFPGDDHPQFLDFATNLAGALRNTIFVDQVVYPFLKKQEALKLLEEHITENIVKINERYYRQTVGIPQGSILSSLLCSFFYGDMESQFKDYVEDPQGVVMRLIDDYIYITTSKSNAAKFLATMNEGHPEYGCFISKDKTLTNFDFGADVMNVTPPGEKFFRWCGFAINMKDLSVTVDYTRYQGTNLTDTLTVERGQAAGTTFVTRMIGLAGHRGHIVFYDPEINDVHVAYLNAYQNFLLVAMRMHAYVRAWGINVEKHSMFIHKTIKQVISTTFSTICHRRANMRATGESVKLTIRKPAVLWLGIHAFYTALSRKPTRFAHVVELLRREMMLPGQRRFQKRFKKVITEGVAGMLEIRY